LLPSSQCSSSLSLHDALPIWVDEKRSMRAIYKPWALKQERLLEQLTAVGTKFLQQLYELFTGTEFRVEHLVQRFEKSYDYFYPKDRKSTRLNSSHVKISYAVF